MNTDELKALSEKLESGMLDRAKHQLMMCNISTQTETFIVEVLEAVPALVAEVEALKVFFNRTKALMDELRETAKSHHFQEYDRGGAVAFEQCADAIENNCEIIERALKGA